MLLHNTTQSPLSSSNPFLSNTTVLSTFVASVLLVPILARFSNNARSSSEYSGRDLSGNSGNFSSVAVVGIGDSISFHVPIACASYARRWSCRTPS